MFLLITFIRTGAFQVQPILSSIPADVPQISSMRKSPFLHMGNLAPKPMKKALKLKGKDEEPAESAALVTSATAPGNDQTPVILKVITHFIVLCSNSHKI